MSALLSGEIVAGGMKETLYQKFGKEKLRIVSTSESMPNFAISVLPEFPIKIRNRLVKDLLKLMPLSNPRDAKIVKDWDDEIKNGFELPEKDFLPSIVRTRNIFKDVTNDNR